MARGLRGVRDDLTELGRHLADIACFLHPLLPPPHALAPESPTPSRTSSSDRRSPSPSPEVASDADAAAADARNAPSRLSVSSCGGGAQDADSGVGVTDEVIEVVRGLAQDPQAWMVFTAPEADDGFTIFPIEREHIAAVEQLVPDLLELHNELVPTYMNEDNFGKIYFRLLNAKLAEQNLEYLESQQDRQADAYSHTHVCEIESEKESQPGGYNSDAFALPKTTSGQSMDQWVITETRSQQSLDQWSEIPSDADSFKESRRYISSEESSSVDGAGAGAVVMEKYMDSIIISRSSLQPTSSGLRRGSYRRKRPVGGDRNSSRSQHPQPAAKMSEQDSWSAIEDSEFEILDSS